MSNLNKLSKMFAERNNPFQINITTGEVISADPIRIKYGDRVVLESSDLYIADALISGYIGEYTDDNGTTVTTKTVTVKNELQKGDKVILVPDNSFNKWYVVDKLGVLS